MLVARRPVNHLFATPGLAQNKKLEKSQLKRFLYYFLQAGDDAERLLL